MRLQRKLHNFGITIYKFIQDGVILDDNDDDDESDTENEDNEGNCDKELAQSKICFTWTTWRNKINIWQ